MTTGYSGTSSAQVGIHARYEASACFIEAPHYAFKTGRSHTRWPRAPVLPREDGDGVESARGDCQTLSEWWLRKFAGPRPTERFSEWYKDLSLFVGSIVSTRKGC
ncbi:hypothetical protein FB451DRAFT_1168299 [Mycena latifolia]|nr:hypothetical protein FB451DRAFT_1168299 [Mycena latifolia]